MSEFQLCAECRTQIRCASQRKCDMPVFHGASRDDIAARERALSGGFGEAPSDHGSNDKAGDGLFLPLEAIDVSAPGGFQIGWCVVDANKRVIGYCMTEKQAHQLADAANGTPRSAGTRPGQHDDLYAAKMGDLLVDSAWATCVGQCISFVCHLDGTPADKQCERLYISRERFDQHIAPYLHELANLQHRLNCIAQFDRESIALAEERGRLSVQSASGELSAVLDGLRQMVRERETRDLGSHEFSRNNPAEMVSAFKNRTRMWHLSDEHATLLMELELRLHQTRPDDAQVSTA